jgi:hypothetical protein
MEVIWKDGTTYSRYATERKQGVWETTIPNVGRVSIVNSHIHFPGEWLLNCRALGFDNLQFGKTPEMSPEQAKQMALIILYQKAESTRKALFEILNP